MTASLGQLTTNSGQDPLDELVRQTTSEVTEAWEAMYGAACRHLQDLSGRAAHDGDQVGPRNLEADETLRELNELWSSGAEYLTGQGLDPEDLVEQAVKNVRQAGGWNLPERDGK